MSARCAVVSYHTPVSAYVSTATRVFVIHDLYTVTRFARAKINAASIWLRMRCRSVICGMPSQMMLSIPQNFSAAHIMP
jgi:hypothetical protein